LTFYSFLNNNNSIIISVYSPFHKYDNKENEINQIKNEGNPLLYRQEDGSFDNFLAISRFTSKKMGYAPFN
jgi:hypothetical protein